MEKFSTEWFLSTECINEFNRIHSILSFDEIEIFDWVTSTGKLWNKLHALMLSALKHKDFNPEICASSQTMSRIIREAVNEFNKHVDTKIGKLSAESKKRIGLALIYYWEA